uniref:Mediator of RNA polymerase II transcription subunit 13 n=1 Tax=Panagrellus redivivus TaxID=6233 RepID=A0A7E4UXY5_PANRE
MTSLPSTSLEECYTNCFSLAEVNGLSWTCLTSSTSTPPESLDDCPVLSGFKKAQAEGVVSLWRRIPGPLRTLNETGGPVFQSTAISVKAAKELWIFWYGQTKPPLVDTLLTNGLKESETDSWSNGGLPYKIRTLFYDALINHMEKLLVEAGYSRFGRWYCQPIHEPITNRPELIPKHISAFDFEFFVVGDREVCIQMRIQRQPTLIRVPRRILKRKGSQAVILAPWGLRGQLLPNQPLLEEEKKPENAEDTTTTAGVNLKNFAGLYSESASKAQLAASIEEQMAQWAAYTVFSQPPPNANVDESLPKMLLVDVDGVPMFYPSHLVAIVADELEEDDDVLEEERQESRIVPHNGKKKLPLAADGIEIEPFTAVELLEPILTTSYDSAFTGLRIARKLFEEAAFPTERVCDRWFYLDLTRSELCTCRVCSSNNGDPTLKVLEKPDSLLLPSVSPAVPAILPNPSTPRSIRNSDPPPSVPPTSIESVQSVDLRQFRRNPRTRYVQPQFLWKADDHITAQDIEKSPRVEQEVEYVNRNEPSARTSWVAPISCQHEAVKSFADGSHPNVENVYHLLPGFRTDDELDVWDECNAPERTPTPFTPMTCVTPSTPLTEQQEKELEAAKQDFDYTYDPMKKDDIEYQEYHVLDGRDKPIGLETIEVDSPTPENEKSESPEPVGDIIVKEVAQPSDDDDDCISQVSASTVWSVESLPSTKSDSDGSESEEDVLPEGDFIEESPDEEEAEVEVGFDEDADDVEYDPETMEVDEYAEYVEDGSPVEEQEESSEETSDSAGTTESSDLSGSGGSSEETEESYEQEYSDESPQYEVDDEEQAYGDEYGEYQDELDPDDAYYREHGRTQDYDYQGEGYDEEGRPYRDYSDEDMPEEYEGEQYSPEEEYQEQYYEEQSSGSDDQPMGDEAYDRPSSSEERPYDDGRPLDRDDHLDSDERPYGRGPEGYHDDREYGYRDRAAHHYEEHYDGRGGGYDDYDPRYHERGDYGDYHGDGGYGDYPPDYDHRRDYTEDDRNRYYNDYPEGYEHRNEGPPPQAEEPIDPDEADRQAGLDERNYIMLQAAEVKLIAMVDEGKTFHEIQDAIRKFGFNDEIIAALRAKLKKLLPQPDDSSEAESEVSKESSPEVVEIETYAAEEDPIVLSDGDSDASTPSNSGAIAEDEFEADGSYSSHSSPEEVEREIEEEEFQFDVSPQSTETSSLEPEPERMEEVDDIVKGVVFSKNGKNEVVIGLNNVAPRPDPPKPLTDPPLAKLFAEERQPFYADDVEILNDDGGTCRVYEEGAFDISDFPPTPSESEQSDSDDASGSESGEEEPTGSYEHSIERVANPVNGQRVAGDVEMAEVLPQSSIPGPSSGAPVAPEPMEMESSTLAGLLGDSPGPRRGGNQSVPFGDNNEIVESDSGQTSGYSQSSQSSSEESSEESSQSTSSQSDQEMADETAEQPDDNVRPASPDGITTEEEESDDNNLDESDLDFRDEVEELLQEFNSNSHRRKKLIASRRFQRLRRKVTHMIFSDLDPKDIEDMTNDEILAIVEHRFQLFFKSGKRFKKLAPRMCPTVLAETVHHPEFLGNVFKGEVFVTKGLRRILEVRQYYNDTRLAALPKYCKQIIEQPVPVKPKINVHHSVAQREREIAVARRSATLAPFTPNDAYAVGPLSAASNLKRQAMMHNAQQRAAFGAVNGPPMYGQSPYHHGPPSNAMASPGQASPMMGRSAQNMFSIHGANTGGSVQMSEPSYGGSHPEFGSPQMNPMRPGSVYSGVGSVSNTGFPNSVASNPAIGFPGPGPDPGMSTVPSNSTPQTMMPYGNGISGMDSVRSAATVDGNAFEKPFKGYGYVLAVLLKDSLFNLHYDTIFDSCPLCSCNESIRTVEYGIYLSISSDIRAVDLMRSTSESSLGNVFSGLYIKPSDDGEEARCLCAFSAVRHRYLCAADSNLFADDVREAIGGPAQIDATEGSNFQWFDLLNESSWKVLDMLRWYLLGHDVAGLVRFASSVGPIPEIVPEKTENCAHLPPTQAYAVSSIDQSELDFVASTAIDASIISNKNGGGIFPAEDIRRLIRNKSADELQSVIHPWAVQIAKDTRAPSESENNAVLFRVCKLAEGLGSAINKDISVGIIEGPLTWKALHRKATGKFRPAQPAITEDGAPEPPAWHAPEPIPTIIVGSERDLVTTSPASIWAWDRSSLAPYSWPKDVIYIGAIPDQSVINEKTQLFLEDLSNYYERHRLGRHMPMPPPPTRDNSDYVGAEVIKIGDNSFAGATLTDRIDNYINALTSEIVRFFKRHPGAFGKRCWYEAIYRSANTIAGSSAAPKEDPLECYVNLNTRQPSPPNLVVMNMVDGGYMQRVPDDTYPKRPPEDPLHKDNIAHGIEECILHDEGNRHLPHVIVVYVVNPFSYGVTATSKELTKLVTSRFMRAFNHILMQIEPHLRPRFQFELLDMSTVMNYGAYSSDPLSENIFQMTPATFADAPTSDAVMRRLAFTVYSQPRQLSIDSVRDIIAKSVTRFGPAAQAMDLLDAMPRTQQPYYHISSMPFILAPRGSNYEFAKGKLVVKNPDEKVLICTYCLVRDAFLIATVTDDRGELTDSVVLSISRPTKSSTTGSNSSTSHVGDALNRLWIFLQGVMALDTKGWRLVIGRFGKLGHGEFKAWNVILSKKNLHAYNVSLKGRDKDVMTPAPGSLQAALNGGGSCRTCTLNPGFSEVPSIITACLVSTEAEPFLRLFPELLSEKAPKGFRLQPLDYSVTHIMVFPTSPNIQDNTDQGIADNGDEDLFPELDMLNEERDEDMDMAMGDLFNGDIEMKMVGTIPNQPIAVGYSISSAPALDVPEWFFAMCPSMRAQTPVHLKSALHINVPHIQNDDLSFNKPTTTDTHVLDSSASDDVLKYVLQTYNDLSWMNLDMVTGQRKSCLPVHIQSLLRLHNGLETFF